MQPNRYKQTLKKHVHIRSNPRGRIYTNRQKYQHGSHIRRAKSIILRTLFENKRFNKCVATSYQRKLPQYFTFRTIALVILFMCYFFKQNQ